MDILKKIDSLQIDQVKKWHHEEMKLSHAGFLGIIEQQHQQNYLLWHEEDIARAPDVDDTEIARVKRSIDRLNQKRNDLIEQIDEGILSALDTQGVQFSAEAPLNSETPGSIIDRCSIASLKIYHMEEQALRKEVTEEHRQKSMEKMKILKIQREDLFNCLYELVNDVKNAKRRFNIYRQFKMYNDPSLNPKIYSAKS